jgi:hypothetical protein
LKTSDESVRMPFGEYRGLAVEDLPDEYLNWLFTLDTLIDPLLSAVEDEILCRMDLSADVRKMAYQIVNEGYHGLATKNHPDLGGNAETMKVVNIAAAWLRRQLPRIRQQDNNECRKKSGRK